MSGNSSRFHRTALIATAFVLVLGSASLARAEAGVAEPENPCGTWTLFPDFRCDRQHARPDGAFNPLGMPYLFEDPYITSNLHFLYVYHQFPEGAVLDDGEFHVLALQIRLALTERIAFIATKDGLGMMFPGENSAVDQSTGIMDMSFGLKFSLFETEDRDFILSPALRYEVPMGNRSLFQRYGSGVFIPSASFRWGLAKMGLPGMNIVGSLGGQVPADGDANVQSLFYNLRFDYGIPIQNSIVKYIVPFIELNGIHYTKSGDGTNEVFLRGGGKAPLGAAQTLLGTGPFEGVDVANLGSQGIADEDIFVVGGGFQIPTVWGITFGVMYEGPVSGRTDIHDQRFTFSAMWEL